MESAGEALGDTRAFLVDLVGLVALVDLVDLLDLIFRNFFGGLLSDKDEEEVDESLELDPVRPEMSDKRYLDSDSDSDSDSSEGELASFEELSELEELEEEDEEEDDADDEDDEEEDDEDEEDAEDERFRFNV